MRIVALLVLGRMGLLGTGLGALSKRRSRSTEQKLPSSCLGQVIILPQSFWEIFGALSAHTVSVES